jgi:hypothetical protein
MNVGKWLAGAALLLTGTAAAFLAFRSAPAEARSQVCDVLGTSFPITLARGELAWLWPEPARRLIAAHRWTAVAPDVIRSCPGRAAQALMLSEDGSLAQVTIGDPATEMGSMETCLLQRRGTSWLPVGCKLDQVN